jgi:hypothetical protein
LAAWTIAPICDKAAVEPEDERGDAVCQPHSDDAERSACHEREPHHRDVLEGIAELARHDGHVRAPEVASLQQSQRALRRERRADISFLGQGRDRLRHVHGH